MKMIIIIFTLLFPAALAIDTITPTTPLPINQTLVSNDESFELGFFKDTSYLGIWYKHIYPKVYVWVANRDAPLTSMSSGSRLAIGEDGNVVILDEHQNTVWRSSNQSFVGSIVAQLLDSGNFVIRLENDDNLGNYLWQSFEHPTDTLLPGMKLGQNRKTGTNRFLRSWKTNDDPGTGEYDLKMDTDGPPDMIMWKNGIKWYRGAWNGKRLTGVLKVNNSVIDFELLDTVDENSFRMLNYSVYSRLIMTSSGYLRHYIWVNSSQTWGESWFFPREQCDNYKHCGPNGICDPNPYPFECTCLEGFEVKNQHTWNLRDAKDGCVRSSKLDCRSDGFLKLSDMKLPESSKVFVDQKMDLTSCGAICKRDCSCAAYAYMDITEGGSGCVIWKGDLIDIRRYADIERSGEELYIRVAASDLASSSTTNQSSSTTNQSSSTTNQASGKSSKNHLDLCLCFILILFSLLASN